MAFADASLARLRKLLDLPESHRIVLAQGGASAQFGLVPLNFRRGNESPIYAAEGHWGRKALAEARKLGPCRDLPRAELRDVQADYVHVTSNETIEGLQWHRPPETRALKVCDMSSDIAWAPVDLGAYDLVYASAQKNLGIAGLTLLLLSPRVRYALRSSRGFEMVFQSLRSLS